MFLQVICNSHVNFLGDPTGAFYKMQDEIFMNKEGLFLKVKIISYLYRNF